MKGNHGTIRCEDAIVDKCLNGASLHRLPLFFGTDTALKESLGPEAAPVLCASLDPFTSLLDFDSLALRTFDFLERAITENRENSPPPLVMDSCTFHGTRSSTCTFYDDVRRDERDKRRHIAYNGTR